MGSFAGSGSGGKYEGFGNSPISKGTVTDRVRDMLEGVINMPDPKKQIMARNKVLKLCLLTKSKWKSEFFLFWCTFVES